jgi:hypothetical protein
VHFRNPAVPVEGDLETRAIAINREIETLVRDCPASTFGLQPLQAAARRRAAAGRCRRRKLMQLAFCLYKYFPHGGLQRDFMRIAFACQARGHAIRVYTLEWRGEVPRASR